MLAFARSARNVAALRQTCRNASCTASSAWRSSRSTRSASPYAILPDPLVQLRERVLVATCHERDQGFVGEVSVVPAHGEAILRRWQR